MLYAVVVEQHLNTQARQSTAQRLALMLRVSAQQIDQQLQVGPLTVEADLTLEEARSVRDRYLRQDISTHILDGTGQLIDDVSQGVSTSANQTAPVQHTHNAHVDLFDDEIQAVLGTLDFEQMMAQLADSSSAAPPEPVTSGPITTPPEPTVSKTSPPIQPTLGAWGEVLGETIETPAVDNTTVLAPTPEIPHSVERPDAQSASPEGNAWGALGFAGESSLEPAAKVEPVVPVATPVDTGLPSFGVESIDAQQPVAQKVLAQRHFDAEQLEEAFMEPIVPEPSSTGVPKREGYDNRPPHSVEIATILSVVAPGAAQIYNGDKDKVWHYGTWFFLIVPWVLGVRHARESAKKIEANQRPMPEEGSLASAFKYMAIWYVVVIAIVSFFGISIGKLIDNGKPKQDPSASSPFFVNLAAQQAQQLMRSSVVAAADDAEQEAEALDEKNQMTPEERAQRLFVTSLPSCETRNLRLCKASMQRVTEIDSKHAHAFKVQVWASLQLKGAKPVPMPKVKAPASLQAMDRDMSDTADMDDVADMDDDMEDMKNASDMMQDPKKLDTVPK